MVALATAYNARETEGGTTKQELLHFVDEVSLSVNTIAFMLHTHTRTLTRTHTRAFRCSYMHVHTILVCFRGISISLVCKPRNNESILVSRTNSLLYNCVIEHKLYLSLDV